MVYRTILGVCLSAVVFAACSSDQQTSAPTDSGTDGGSTGGSGGTGGKGTGGKGTGGSNTGGSNTGGASTGGVGGTDAGDSGGGTGGRDASPGTGGKGGTGGTATGGAAGDGGPSAEGGSACTVLTACCQNLTGRQRTACTTIAASGTAGNCAAVTDLFCSDAGLGPIADGGTRDGGGGCTALAACCSDSGPRGAQCATVVANGDDAVCNQIAPFFCK